MLVSKTILNPSIKLCFCYLVVLEYCHSEILDTLRSMGFYILTAPSALCMRAAARVMQQLPEPRVHGFVLRIT